MKKENAALRKSTILFLSLIGILIVSACNLASLMETEPPTVKITAPGQGEEIVAGDTITLSFEATSTTKDMTIPFVELNLNSVNGQSVASYGSMSSAGKVTPVAETVTWTPQQAGEYTLYMSAYDAEGNASAPDTLKVTVYARPQAGISGRVTLQNNQSYDIMTQVIEYYDGDGDFVVWHYPEGWSVQNPDTNEITGVHLYSVANNHYKSVSERLYDVKLIRKLYSNSLWSFSNADFYVATGELYLFKRAKTPGGFILIPALDVNDESLTLEFVTFDITK